MTNHPTPPGGDPLAERVAELERLLSDLTLSDRLQSASFRAPGSITYRDADGTRRFLVGEMPTSGGIGLLVEQADGVDAFRVTEQVPLTVRYLDGTVALIINRDGIFEIKDLDGRQTFATDIDNGGLARPYLPLPFRPDIGHNEKTTTSGSFQNLWRIDGYLQHPKVQVRFFARADGGTTGQARLWNETEDVQVGSTVAIGDGAYFESGIGPSLIDTAMKVNQYHDLRLQARRTGGSGNVGLEVVRAYGVQS